MIRAALAAGLVAGVLGAMVPPAGRAMTPQPVDLAGASARNDAPAMLAWDGVRMQALDMHGECDLATTITPLAGHTGPGVHRIDATLTLPDAPVLTAIGLYTVDAVPASATPSPPPGPDSGGRGLKYAAGIAAVLALIAIAVVARRRRPA